MIHMKNVCVRYGVRWVGASEHGHGWLRVVRCACRGVGGDPPALRLPVPGDIPGPPGDIPGRAGTLPKKVGDIPATLLCPRPPGRGYPRPPGTSRAASGISPRRSGISPAASRGCPRRAGTSPAFGAGHPRPAWGYPRPFGGCPARVLVVGAAHATHMCRCVCHITRSKPTQQHVKTLSM